MGRSAVTKADHILTMPLLLLCLLECSAPFESNRAFAAERGSDAQVREMMQIALDDAFSEQIRHLFTTWMKDPNHQPERAAAGVRRAVKAYRHAIEAIDKEKLTWIGIKSGTVRSGE